MSEPISSPRPLPVNLAEMLGRGRRDMSALAKEIDELLAIEQRRLSDTANEIERQYLRDMQGLQVAIREALMRFHLVVRQTDRIRGAQEPPQRSGYIIVDG